MHNIKKKTPIKINSPIVGFKVLTDEPGKQADTPTVSADPPAQLPDVTELEVIHPDMIRPAVIDGHTWKIKPPTEETGLYMTINEIVLNKGTANECRRPLEIFLNSKHLESYMWVTALTVTISGLMHAGNDLAFLPGQLMQIADPKSGGYWGKDRHPDLGHKGKQYISVISEIGYILKYYFIDLGILARDPLTIEEEKALEKTKLDMEIQQSDCDNVAVQSKNSAIPKKAEQSGISDNLPRIDCPECGAIQSMLMLDGCWTCIADADGDGCGHSKCG